MGDGFRGYLRLVTFWRPDDLKDLVRKAYPDTGARPGARLGLTPWIAEGVALTETALWAMARSLREEPETREVAALAFGSLHKFARPFLHSHLTVVDPSELFPGVSETPAGAYFEANWLGQLGRAAHVSRQVAWPHAAREQELYRKLYRKALEGDPEDPIVAERLRRARADLED
jgi:hypothetical protein